MEKEWQATLPALQLEIEVLEERIAPSIVLTNPGGNEPQGTGAANGQAIDFVNPAGHAPPGQNT
jgi:hypothetical protein